MDGYLVSKLSDPNVTVVCIVKVVGIVDDSRRVGGIAMESHNVNLGVKNEVTRLVYHACDIHGNLDYCHS